MKNEEAMARVGPQRHRKKEKNQHMHNYFTDFHSPTCFDTIVSSSGSL